MTSPSSVTFSISTPRASGAIAIIDLFGDVEPMLVALTGSTRWSPGRLYVREIAGVDRGVVVMLNATRAQLMPHGGPRVRQRIRDALLEHGATPAVDPDPRDRYPEASSWLEAVALETIARAASPDAIDLLLDQPRRWRDLVTAGFDERAWTDIVTRSRWLDRLITPASVVVVGPPNAGKSTLTNALMGRSTSLVADRPGTTRDYVGGVLDLAGTIVWWYDTPGLRATRDQVEAEAQTIATKFVEQADCLIAARGPNQSWPTLERPPDLRVRLQSDLADDPEIGPNEPADCAVSAAHGEGLADFVTIVRDLVVPRVHRDDPGPWRFDPRISPDRVREAD